MGRISLSNGYTPIPEGTHIFKIIGVTYKEEYGKLEIKMQTREGLTHTERYTLVTKDGEQNDGALSAFSFFARTALNDFSAQDIDPEELVGYFMECDVEHDVQASSKNPDKTVTFVRLAEKRSSEGWVEEEPSSAVSNAPAHKSGQPLDLDALLG